MKGRARHRAVYRVLWVLLYWPIRWFFKLRFSPRRAQAKNYLLLCNHNTDFDPFLVGAAFFQPMYFVASEHIFRWGIWSKLINFLQAPIARLKGRSDMHTVRSVLQALKSGYNVCIFAEGRATFNGETCQITDASGKLARLSGVSLVTYSLKGAYFAKGRWMASLRRGRIDAGIVNEYSPEQLRSMSQAEINEAIRRDLYVNAYAHQAEHMYAYRGARLAETLEQALFICPACGAMEGLKSEDDHFFCTCGYTLRYTEYGYFEREGGGQPYFTTVLDWDHWQKERLREMVEQWKAQAYAGVIFFDRAQTATTYERVGSTDIAAQGAMRAYLDRLEIGEGPGMLRLPYADIIGVATQSRDVLLLSTAQEDYEVKSAYPRSAVKYELLYHLAAANQRED